MAHSRQKRALVSWSGGKDAAFALWTLQQRKDTEVMGLICSVEKETGRVPIHGVPHSLIEKQARLLGLPLLVLHLPQPCSNQDYEAHFRQALNAAKNDLSIDCVAFGDLFLKDIRVYREKFLATLDLEPLFPLWEKKTPELARHILAAGFDPLIVSVDSRELEESWLGKKFDANFLKHCPKTIDPCGENGEFHTFVRQGPTFKKPIGVTPGAIHQQGNYRWIELNET